MDKDNKSLADLNEGDLIQFIERENNERIYGFVYDSKVDGRGIMRHDWRRLYLPASIKSIECVVPRAKRRAKRIAKLILTFPVAILFFVLYFILLGIEYISYNAEWFTDAFHSYTKWLGKHKYKV